MHSSVTIRDRIGLTVDRHFSLLMVLPTLLLLGLLVYFPIIEGIRLSFLDYILIKRERPFIGLGNYIELLRTPRFLFIIWNTILFALLANGFSTLIGLIVALALNRSGKLTGVYRAIGYMPWITPVVVFSVIWVWAFSKSFSPFNAVLLQLGWIDDPISFLGDIKLKILGLTAPFLSVLYVRVWFSFPFKMTMLLAGLQNIPKERYEAAYVDGASPWQQLWHIMLPGVLPVLLITVAMSTIWNLNHFGVNYLMTAGGPRDLTSVLPVFIYMRAFNYYKMGSAAAAGMYALLINTVVGVIYLRYVRTKETP